ncbi:hypothetical protein GCM10010329_65370 [Streptomyces spiroverticillatus]|uniref:Ig-like domain-containing protein n=2 Tax=Streptomyces finlayi TaxID=67296 RepID=A0A918X4S8_9ACTN|nr:hypothetical protein GCM10010329_65370 [Streptomyces spiroverticillatus]GHD10257.1 hypothetical protein GCM10010334_65180 [Streptomyces finlayi]
MRIRACVVLTAALLLGAVGCDDATGPKPDARPTAPPRHPVYSERLADQLVAAGKTTKAAGTARFTSTFTWDSPAGKLVDTTTGDQSFGSATAHATRTLTIPKGFPETVQHAYADNPGSTRRTYAVQDTDVFYRTKQGGWLRYPSDSTWDFAWAKGDLADLAGTITPYGGTLADVAFASFPTAPPKTLADGTRRYSLKVPSGNVSPLLPHLESPAGKDSRRVPEIPLTVDLDKNGRLVRSTADLTAFLKEFDVGKATSLRAELTFTGYGTPVAAAVPQGQKTEDASKALTLLTQVEPGDCAVTDNGLGTWALVRRTDCGDPHDLRVFGQVTLEESHKGTLTEDDGYDMAMDRCGDKYDAVPQSWVAEALPSGYYYTNGTGSAGSDGNIQDGASTRVHGKYTCYVRTS